MGKWNNISRYFITSITCKYIWSNSWWITWCRYLLKEQDIESILEENHKLKHTREVKKSIELLRISLNKYPNNLK